jgi:radical SAM superfamily enzyme YgiQ (UPF0313 family)
MTEKKIALVNFGRSHWFKLPQLGLIILNNKINSLKGYSCEMFDYGEVPIYIFGGDHLSIIHYNSFDTKFPVGFIPELPILDLILRFIKDIPNIEDINFYYFKDKFLCDQDKLNFVLNFCKKIGHNPYLFIEMLERIFKILPKILIELKDIEYIGFFNHTANFFGTLLVSEILRMRCNKKILGGGPQITSSYTYMKSLVDKGLFYDYIVYGDAEDEIGVILDQFTKGEAKSYAFSRDLAAIDTFKNEYNFDCVLDKGYKYHHFIFDLSRGCPARCSFCGEYKIHGRACLKDPVVAAEQLVRLTERHSENENFIPVWRIGDSLINFNEDFLNKFLDRLIELKKTSKNPYVAFLSFYGYARGDISPELAKKLWQAGCIQLWIGVESFHNEFLEKYNKGLTIEEITDTIINILKNKISVGLLLITPSNAMIDVPENHLYYEVLGIKNFAKRIIKEIKFYKRKSGLSPYIQKVFIAAHTMLTMVGSGSFHEQYPKENWELTDFFERDYNPYSNIPRNYILKGDMKQTIQDYYHKDQILRKMFPINKTSKIDRMDELLEFSSIGCQAKPLSLFQHNVLQTPDYFTLKKDSALSLKDIRTYLIEKSTQQQ